MIQIILLVAGIAVALRLSKIKGRKVEDFPGVDPLRFRTWNDADYRSAVAFVIATWGALAVQVAILLGGTVLAAAAGPGARDGIQGVALLLSIIAFVVPLVWAAVLGSKATRLRKEAGIA